MVNPKKQLFFTLQVSLSAQGAIFVRLQKCWLNCVALHLGAYLANMHISEFKKPLICHILQSKKQLFFTQQVSLIAQGAYFVRLKKCWLNCIALHLGAYLANLHISEFKKPLICHKLQSKK